MKSLFSVEWDDLPNDTLVRVREGLLAFRDPQVGRRIEFTDNLRKVRTTGRVLKWFTCAQAEATTDDYPDGYCHKIEPGDWAYVD